jgi:DnaD/phage-associated family protein
MAKDRVVLRPHNFIPYTLIPNFFIDHALAKTNGEFIKVYLVLLRFMSVGQLDFDLSQIADHLLMTENDVLRALNYFQLEKLLTLTFSGNRLKEIHLVHQIMSDPIYSPKYNSPQSVSENKGSFMNPSPISKEYDTSYESNYNNSYQGNHASVESESTSYATEFDDIESMPHTEQPTPNLKVISSRPEYTMKDVAFFAEEEEFSQLLYIVQKYLGKTLSANEVKTIISFHDWLGLPIEVVELLIEYCVSNDHRNLRYIEKVAIDWADSGINTLEKAKVRTETYHKSYFSILKSYGITDRSPTPNQIKLMDKWLKEYNFDLAIIQNACERTITQINKAEMRYTDTILEQWFKSGVRTLKDVIELDKQASREPRQQVQKQGQTAAPNKFSNYTQRDYDYEALEKKALEMRLKETTTKRYSS